MNTTTIPPGRKQQTPSGQAGVGKSGLDQRQPTGDESRALKSARIRSMTERSKAEAARLKAEHRTATLTILDGRLSGRRSAIKQTKKQLKQYEADLKRLTAERKARAKALATAQKQAAAADKSARKAEANYDHAMLREMVQREKQADLRIHGAKAKVGASRVGASKVGASKIDANGKVRGSSRSRSGRG
jgi:chromosome segregation ATPase